MASQGPVMMQYSSVRHVDARDDAYGNDACVVAQGSAGWLSTSISRQHPRAWAHTGMC